jgi:dCMP deaminase
VRVGWDEYFLGIARAVAVRADCSRSQVGAVAVHERRIIATGYNGTEPGSELSCVSGHCPRVAESPEPGRGPYNCINTHAEINCLQQIWQTYGDIRTTLYVTREPCDECWLVLKDHYYIIYRVVWPGGDTNP